MCRSGKNTDYDRRPFSRDGRLDFLCHKEHAFLLRKNLPALPFQKLIKWTLAIFHRTLPLQQRAMLLLFQ